MIRLYRTFAWPIYFSIYAAFIFSNAVSLVTYGVTLPYVPAAVHRAYAPRTLESFPAYFRKGLQACRKRPNEPCVLNTSVTDIQNGRIVDTFMCDIIDMSTGQVMAEWFSPLGRCQAEADEWMGRDL